MHDEHQDAVKKSTRGWPRCSDRRKVCPSSVVTTSSGARPGAAGLAWDAVPAGAAGRSAGLHARPSRMVAATSAGTYRVIFTPPPWALFRRAHLSLLDPVARGRAGLARAPRPPGSALHTQDSDSVRQG